MMQLNGAGWLPWRSRVGAPPAAGSRQGVVLPLLGVVVGFLLAAVGLLRKAPPRITTVPPGYVALVNGQGLLTNDFISELEADSGKKFAETTPEERSKTLRAMINEELLVQRGLVLGVPETTTEVRDAITRAVNAQAAAALLEIQPTDAQLRDYYNAHVAAYTSGGSMTVQDLLLRFGGYQDMDQSESQARADASDAVYQLRSGASVEHVMEHFGFVRSGRVIDGEELDFAAKLHLGDKLYAAASTLADGEVSEPVVDADGIHVLIMVRRQPPAVAPFSSVRGRVYTDYRQDLSQRAQVDALQALRAQAQILLAPGQSE